MIPKTKTIGEKKYLLDAVRSGKKTAQIRAKNMKRYWKNIRVIKVGKNDWATYVRGKK